MNVDYKYKELCNLIKRQCVQSMQSTMLFTPITKCKNNAICWHVPKVVLNSQNLTVLFQTHCGSVPNSLTGMYHVCDIIIQQRDTMLFTPITKCKNNAICWHVPKVVLNSQNLTVLFQTHCAHFGRVTKRVVKTNWFCRVIPSRSSRYVGARSFCHGRSVRNGTPAILTQ